jgi:hypothetical protein
MEESEEGEIMLPEAFGGMKGVQHQSAAAPAYDNLSPQVSHWVSRMAAVGGLSKKNLAALYEGSSEGKMKHAARSMEELSATSFHKEAANLAGEIRAVEIAVVTGVNRSTVREPMSVKLLGEAVIRVRTLSDGLVAAVGGAGEAMAVYRQLSIRSSGCLSMSRERLKELKPLMSEELLEVLEGMAEFGVPLCDLEEDLEAVGKRSAPMPSAYKAAEDITYGALRDVARGHALLFSGESLSALGRDSAKFFLSLVSSGEGR